MELPGRCQPRVYLVLWGSKASGNVPKQRLGMLKGVDACGCGPFCPFSESVTLAVFPIARVLRAQSV